DTRKCEFLREAARKMDVALDVRHERVEQLAATSLPAPVDCFTARAFAPVADILHLTDHLRDKHSRYLLLKGRQAGQELEAARQHWDFNITSAKDVLAEEAAIVILTQVLKKQHAGGMHD